MNAKGMLRKVIKNKLDLEAIGWNHPDVQQAFEKAVDFAELEILDLLTRDNEALDARDIAFYVHRLLGHWLALLTTLRELEYQHKAPALVKDTGVLVHVIGAPFLRECLANVRFSAANSLGPLNCEKMVYVMGFVHSNVAFPMRIISFKTRASAAHAKADPESVARAMAEVEPFDYTLLGLYHSHPGTGPQGPSLTDRDMQASWEPVYQHCIGGIFTDEGYVHFFRSQDDFRIQVIGEGVQQVDKHIFLLEGQDEKRS